VRHNGHAFRVFEHVLQQHTCPHGSNRIVFLVSKHTTHSVLVASSSVLRFSFVFSRSFRINCSRTDCKSSISFSSFSSKRTLRFVLRNGSPGTRLKRFFPRFPKPLPPVYIYTRRFDVDPMLFVFATRKKDVFLFSTFLKLCVAPRVPASADSAQPLLKKRIANRMWIKANQICRQTGFGQRWLDPRRRRRTKRRRSCDQR